MSILLVIVPLILIVLEGIFTASETGLISIEYIRVRQAKQERQSWAQLVSTFLARPERFFSTILVCENFILVVSSTLFAKFFIDWIGHSGAIVATVILAIISLAIGQFIPKSIALTNPERSMRILSRPIFVIEQFSYPFVAIYAWIAKYLARIVTHRTMTPVIKQLDIIYAMSEYQVKASMLAARLFDFSRRQVSEVMIPLERVFMCEQGKDTDTLQSHGGRVYTRIPVYKDERSNIIGIYNIKDYFYRNKLVLRKTYSVKGHERCMSLFMTMKQQGQHIAVVTEKNGKAIGIVTLEDLIEELVGEIRDEK